MATRKVIKVRLENYRNPHVFFCDAIVDGCKFRVSYGRSTPDRTDIFERTGVRCGSAEEALERLDQLLATRGKGYETRNRSEEELPVVDDTVAPAAENAALEAEVLASDTAGAASVYADWLQTHGDVRGELAALYLAGVPRDAARWLEANAPRVFGELDVKLDSELYDLVWEHGFLRGASLKRFNIESATDLGELTRAFLALPISRLVTALRFGLASYESDNDWTDTLRAVTTARRSAHLRSLRFDDYTYEDCEISWVPFGDFSAFWSALPRLEDLRIKAGAGGTLGAIELPALRTFVRQSGGLAEDEIRSIVEAAWPRLEHLEVWFGRSTYGAQGTPEHVAPLLAGRAPATLAHLGIVNCEFTHELLEPLARSPLLRQLRVLDLSKGVLMDRDVDLLMRHADAFRHLDHLDLSENLFVESLDSLVARLPNAIVGSQRDADDERRYAAVGE